MTETIPSNSCKTLFIIGAGAGYDYNMPLGEDLIGAISSLVSTSNHVKSDGGRATELDLALLRSENYFLSRTQAALSRISAGLVFSRSIDTLLTDTADETVATVGKIAIPKFYQNVKRVQSTLRKAVKSFLAFQPKTLNLIRR
ncbi:MAG: hypothetical protein P8J02_05925 [Yoonia sp.]|nr:hypothetical protein [Yoonia sp.]